MDRRSWLLGLLLFLAGCAPQALVTRFHSLPPVAQGQSIAIEAAEPAQKDSLELAHYRDLAAAWLTKAGYPPPAAGKPPDLIGRLGWRIEGPRSESYATPIYGYTGGGYFVQRVGPNGVPVSVYVPPSYGVVDVAAGTRTIFTMVASFTVTEAKPGGATRFEGRATAESLSPDIAPMMPLLLGALLGSFPGKNGVTEMVTPPES